jgi:thioredoxin-related protein
MQILAAKNLFQVKSQAEEAGKNILILMHLEDCPWCHFVIDEVIAPMTELKEYTDKLIIRQIEINAGLNMSDFNHLQIENNDFADKHDIDFYPTLLLFNAQGSLLGKIIGVTSRDTYWTDLDKTLQRHY